MTASFVVTDHDPEVLGVANSLDGMGVLAIWTTRARTIIPHLTAQTSSARGFQLLVEAFRLWELYLQRRPDHVERVSDFFILVEQAFARTVAGTTGDWSLPGSRRVRARAEDQPHIALDAQEGWQLLGAQKSNGLWGLYRGASTRAGLLDSTFERLSPDVEHFLDTAPILSGKPRDRFLALVEAAMEAATVPLPTDGRDGMVRQIRDGFDAVPAQDILANKLVDATPLTTVLSNVLAAADGSFTRRQVLAEAARVLPDRKRDLDDAVRCEDFVAVLESVFFSLCAATRDRRNLQVAAEELPVDLASLAAAREAFGDSGLYEGIARERQQRFVARLDLESKEALVRSVLELHAWVGSRRGRARWVWEEDGRLVGDVDAGVPDDELFQPGLAWRNDYFLPQLQSIAVTLKALDGTHG